MRSNTHSNLQDLVKEYFQLRGWIAIKEHCIDGKKIDVLAQNISTKYTVANEIQLTPKHYKENIVRDLGVGCDEVRIISINRKVSLQIERKAHKELGADLISKVRFLDWNDLIPLIKQQQTIKNKAELIAEQNTEERRNKSHGKAGINCSSSQR